MTTPVRRRGFGLVVSAAADEDEDVPTEAPAPAPAPAPVEAEVPPAAPAVNPDAARIAEIVAEIKDYLKLLYVKREMNFNEVRLTLAIEDPRLADRRERYGIEDESGVSADEKVEALEAIDAGEMPTDLLACERLLDDFRDWQGGGARGDMTEPKTPGTPHSTAVIINNQSTFFFFLFHFYVFSFFFFPPTTTI